MFASWALACSLLETTSAAYSKTPPMGWSSWYSFGGKVNQTEMEQAFRKLVNRSVVPGLNKSLADAGYLHAKLDDGWQLCGGGVNGSFHDEAGHPVLDTARFPDVKAMTSLAHSLGLLPEFYVNNYICHERMPYGGRTGSTFKLNLAGTVDWMVNNGFEGVKIDSGSVYNDMQEWADAIEARGHPLAVENCHQGGQKPNATWCPYDIWRTSGDPAVVGWEVEVMATAKVLNLSREGCWAYPGYAAYSAAMGRYNNSRTQFGIHAIISSPLVLSFNILDDKRLLQVFDILTNEEAIAVNQRWAGSAGMLLRKWAVHHDWEPLFAWTESCDAGDVSQASWSYDAAARHMVWRSANGTLSCLATGTDPRSWAARNMIGLAACNASDDKQLFVLGKNGRLWEGAGGVTSGNTLQLQDCSETAGQQWTLSDGVAPGDSQQTWVHNDIPYMNACWEIPTCTDREGVRIDTNFGCKGLPKPGWTDHCAANMAWSFNGNGTITSVMNGKCLQVGDNDTALQVFSCDGSDRQRWTINGKTIGSVAFPGKCVDSGRVGPPIGTTGRCVVQGSDVGLDVPGLNLRNGDKDPCRPSEAVEPTVAISLQQGRLHVGSQCIVGRTGIPTAFGPLQIWAKPQPGGSSAILFVNRGEAKHPPTSMDIAVKDLPGLNLESKSFRVRDIWSQSDLSTLRSDEQISVTVYGDDSVFLLLSPVDPLLV